MLSSHQKYFFLVFGFRLLMCKTYLIFKIRWKHNLKNLRVVRENAVAWAQGSCSLPAIAFCFKPPL